jgi:hypothetical protein
MQMILETHKHKLRSSQVYIEVRLHVYSDESIRNDNVKKNMKKEKPISTL